MQSGENNFTFKALLDMALGSSHLTQEHLALLHCLINALLQKLNSRDEIVKIKGLEAQCLVKLLKECQDPPYECKLIDNDECIDNKLEKMDALEQRLENISKKLENHFDLGRMYKRKLDTLYSGEKWDFYTENAEDICSIPGLKSIQACNITCHGIFTQKLRKFMTEPALQRLFNTEKRIDNMSNTLSNLIIESAKIFNEKNFLGPLIFNIETTRGQINTNQKQFVSAMKEVEQMLNAKLDRIAYPAMRTYLKHFFETTRKTLEKITQDIRACPQIKPLLITDSTCLSCGVEKKTLNKKSDTEEQAGCPPYMVLCSSQTEINIRTRMDYMNVNLSALASHIDGKKMSKQSFV